MNLKVVKHGENPSLILGSGMKMKFYDLSTSTLKWKHEDGSITDVDFYETVKTFAEIWGVGIITALPEEGSVKIISSVKITSIFGKLPFKIAEVDGDFIANGIGLTSFENFPKKVTGKVEIMRNRIGGSLIYEGTFGGSFLCGGNKSLYSLEFKNQKVINGDLEIGNCSFGILPVGLERIEGNLDATNNQLSTGKASFYVAGNADLGNNKIVSEDDMLKVGGTVYLSENPVQPDDNLKETATWS